MIILHPFSNNGDVSGKQTGSNFNNYKRMHTGDETLY